MTITTEEVRALAEGAEEIREEQCHYCGDYAHDQHRCRSGGPHDFKPTGRVLTLLACSPEFILALAQDWLRMREALEKLSNNWKHGWSHDTRPDTIHAVEKIARAALQPPSEKAET